MKQINTYIMLIFLKNHFIKMNFKINKIKFLQKINQIKVYWMIFQMMKMNNRN